MQKRSAADQEAMHTCQYMKMPPWKYATPPQKYSLQQDRAISSKAKATVGQSSIICCPCLVQLHSWLHVHLLHVILVGAIQAEASWPMARNCLWRMQLQEAAPMLNAWPD